MLDAYTIKKIAPRLFVAVIAVNISIYLCAAAIDIANIIGGGMSDLMRGPFLKDDSFKNLGIDANAISGTIGVVGAGAAAGIIGTILIPSLAAALVAPLATLGMLFILMIPVFLIAFAILATLVIRYGAIIFLSLISPIAIACWVLPGTEKYFKQWWDIFLKVLIMYPLIAAIFAISDVMVAIFLQTQDGVNDVLATTSVFVILVVLYAPLFMIPFAFKLAGGVLGQIYNFANDNGAKRGLLGGLQKWKQDENNWYGNKAGQLKKERENRGATFAKRASELRHGAMGFGSRKQQNADREERNRDIDEKRAIAQAHNNRMMREHGLNEQELRELGEWQDVPDRNYESPLSGREAFRQGAMGRRSNTQKTNSKLEAQKLLEDEAFHMTGVDEDFSAALKGKNETEVRKLLRAQNAGATESEIDSATAAIMRMKSRGTKGGLEQLANMQNAKATTGNLYLTDRDGNRLYKTKGADGEWDGNTTINPYDENVLRDQKSGDAVVLGKDAGLGELLESSVRAATGPDGKIDVNAAMDNFTAYREAAKQNGQRPDLVAQGNTFVKEEMRKLINKIEVGSTGEQITAEVRAITDRADMHAVEHSMTASMAGNMKKETAQKLAPKFQRKIQAAINAGDHKKAASLTAKVQGIIDVLGHSKPEVATVFSQTLRGEMVDQGNGTAVDTAIDLKTIKTKVAEAQTAHETAKISGNAALIADTDARLKSVRSVLETYAPKKPQKTIVPQTKEVTVIDEATGVPTTKIEITRQEVTQMVPDFSEDTSNITTGNEALKAAADEVYVTHRREWSSGARAQEAAAAEEAAGAAAGAGAPGGGPPGGPGGS